MNRIKDLRQAMGYTQAALADILNCSNMAISRYENGSRDLDTATINRLCDIFNCTADYLLGRTNEPAAQLPRGEELDNELRRLLADLDPEDEPIVKAFIAGLKANKKK